MASKPKVLILTGNGLNCEAESRVAWERAGADVDLVHMHDVFHDPRRLSSYQAIMLIGGFSYGDHLGSGLAMALRMGNALREDLDRFLDADGLILGVCNGFQVLIKLGLLPALDGKRFHRTVTLMQNDCGTFQNFWVDLQFEPTSPCLFTQGMNRLSVPIRHGEGKIYTPDRNVLDAIEKAGCVACRYVDPVRGEPSQEFPYNPNGSLNAIAGLCDPTGRVFGLMPHPEAFLLPHNHPRWDLAAREDAQDEEGSGMAIFRNAVRWLR